MTSDNWTRSSRGEPNLENDVPHLGKFYKLTGSAKNSTLHTRSLGLLAIAALNSFGEICDNLDVTFFQLNYLKYYLTPGHGRDAKALTF